MKQIVSFCAILALLPVYVGAQVRTVDPFVLPSARMAALGGPHAASVAGLDALFENPAGFASETTELGVSSLVFNPAGPIFDIVGMVVGGNDPLAGLATLFDDNGRLYVQADILGPLAFGYVGKGLGFGMYNRSVVTLNAASLLTVAYAVSEEVMLMGGYAHRFRISDRQVLDVGIMPKGFVRATIGDVGSLDDVIALAGSPGSLLSGSGFTMVSGLGFDAGVRWSLDDTLAVGLVAHDAFSPAMVTTYTSFTDFAADPQAAKVGDSAYAIVKPNLAFGIEYNVPFAFLRLLGAELVVLADYVDILDLMSVIPRNPILNVALGVELELLDILSLRAGIKDALPAAGFGVDLAAFTFSLAMFGKELGIEPGARPVFNMLVAFDFRY
jgi:hypothetical protein